ncbi:MAG: hypothetical protein IPN26_17550 [Bacteroidetes bacterium]|nr:hypothetical protein [Bacteroidota bacterium]
MKTRLLLFFILFCSVGNLFAQSYIGFEWTLDTKTSIQVIKSKGAYVYTFGKFNNTVVIDGISYTPNGPSDVLIQKFDTLGNRVWVCQAGGALNNDCYRAHIDDSDYVYVTGIESNPLNAADYQIWTAKVSNIGQLLWSQSAGSNGLDAGLDITSDYAGNVYVSGYVGDTITFAGVTSDRKKGVVIAYTSTGVENWIKASSHGRIVNLEYAAWDSTIHYWSDYISHWIMTAETVRFGDSSYVTIWNNITSFEGKLKLNGGILSFLQASGNGSANNTFPASGDIILRPNGEQVSNGSGSGAYGANYDWGFLNTLTNTYLGQIHLSTSPTGNSILSFFTIFSASIHEDQLYLLSNGKGNVNCYINGKLKSMVPTPTQNLFIFKLSDSSTKQRTFASNEFQLVSAHAYGIFVSHGSYLSKICDSNCAMSMAQRAKDTMACPPGILDTTTYGKITFNGGTPPYTYQWSPSIGINNPNLLNPVFVVDTTRTYVLTISDALNNVIYDTVTFSLFSVPSVQINTVGNTHLCNGSSDTLILKSSHPWLQNTWYRGGNGAPFSSYVQLALDADSIQAHPIPNNNNNVFNNLNYILMTTDSVSGCKIRKDFLMPFYPGINLNIKYLKGASYISLNQRRDTICENIDTLKLFKSLYGPVPYIYNSVVYKWFRDGNYLLSNGYNDYLWIWEAGEYVLEASDGICTLYDTLTIYPKVDSANLNISASANPSCSNTAVQLVSTGANKYLWLPGDYINDTILVRHPSTTTYTVIGQGCLSDDTTTIQVDRLGQDFFTGISSGCGSYILGDTCQLVARDSVRQYGPIVYTQTLCTPDSGKQNSSTKAITNVQFSKLNLTSWSNGVYPAIYEPYLNGDNIQYLEKNYFFELKVKTIDNNTVACVAWVDFDRDGNFSSQESYVLSKILDTFRATIPIPSGAQLGTTVLRVRAVWNNVITGQDACKEFPGFYNETEDYPIHIFETVPFTGNTYSWSPATMISSTTGDSVSVYPNLSSTYQLVSTDSFGCSSIDSIIIPVNFQMASTIADTAVCAGSVLDPAQYGAMLCGGGVPPYSYEWTPNIGLNDSSLLNPTFVIDSTITYVLTVKDSTNAFIRDTVHFIVSPSLMDSIEILGNMHICKNAQDSILLKTHDPTLQNAWYKGLIGSPFSSYSLISTDADSIFVHPSLNENYLLVRTNLSNGCSSTESITLPYYPASFEGIADNNGILAAATDTLCENIDTLRLLPKLGFIDTYASNSCLYNWYKNGTLIASQSMTDSFIVWQTGEYVLEVTDGLCTLFDTLKIETELAIANLQTSISANPTCVNTPVELSANGAKSYIWQPGNATTDTITVNLPGTTTYTVIGTGCYLNDTAYIEVRKSNFVTNILVDSTILCVGDTAHLTVVDSAYQFGSFIYSQANCIPYASNVMNGYISYVQFANTMNYSSGSPMGYSSYDTVLPIEYFNPGEWFDVRVYSPIAGVCTQYCRAWLDFNRDGLFDVTESFELLKIADTFRTSIQIPANAQLGQNRLRLRWSECDSLSSGDACTIITNGNHETEDYALHIRSKTELLGNIYTWTPVQTLSSSVLQQVEAFPIQNTLYSVISQDSIGCAAFAFSQIDVITCCTQTTIDSTLYLGGDSIEVYWTAEPSSSSYDLRYRQQGALGWNVISGILDTKLKLNDLIFSGVYEIEVKPNCSNGISEFGPTYNLTFPIFKLV